MREKSGAFSCKRVFFDARHSTRLTGGWSFFFSHFRSQQKREMRDNSPNLFGYCAVTFNKWPKVKNFEDFLTIYIEKLSGKL